MSALPDYKSIFRLRRLRQKRRLFFHWFAVAFFLLLFLPSRFFPLSPVRSGWSDLLASWWQETGQTRSPLSEYCVRPWVNVYVQLLQRPTDTFTHAGRHRHGDFPCGTFLKGRTTEPKEWWCLDFPGAVHCKKSSGKTTVACPAGYFQRGYCKTTPFFQDHKAFELRFTSTLKIELGGIPSWSWNSIGFNLLSRK